MDGPDKVVNAILHNALQPHEEQPVGWKAKMADISHHLLPDTTERIDADVARREQFEKGAPSPPTTGSIYTPMAQGTGVDDGVRARMKAEDAAAKEKPSS